MYKPFSIGTLAGFATLPVLMGLGSGISPEAQAVNKAANAAVQSTELSQALFGEKAIAISQLRELAIAYAEPGWDGDGAWAIDPFAVSMAESFVRALPEGVPLPEFAPELDGSISLDWIHSKNRLYSLSVSAKNRLAFAWLDGTDRGHGVVRFDGQIIPARILEDINKILNYGNASIWVA